MAEPIKGVAYAARDKFKIDYVYIADNHPLPHSSGVHYHNAGELLIVKSGLASISIGDTIYPGEGSYIVYFPKNIPHCSVALQNHDYSRYCLSIDEKYFSAEVDIPKDGFVISVSQDEIEALLAPTELLHKYFSEDISSYTSIMLKRQDHLLRLLLDEIEAIRKSRSTDNLYSHKSYITKVSEYLSLHFSESISLSKLANDFFVSKAKLTKDFKLQCGVSIGDFIMTLRIRHSKKLLKNSEIPIWKIAEECGYQSSGYFIRQFAKITGTTPMQYRKKHGAE